jgi:hypothetical protein
MGPAMNKLFVAVALPLCLTGCLAAPIPSPEPLQHAQPLSGAVFGDCGPTDGPALVFNLDGDTAECGGNSTKLSISLWRESAEPGTYEIGGSYDHDGTAAACSEAQCLQSKAGTLVIDEKTDGAVSGHFDVELSNGIHTTGKFTVTTCAPRTVLCG